MANFPIIWQFLTAVDMDSLASTPGRNAGEHCCIPDVLLASGYLTPKLSLLCWRIPEMTPADRLLFLFFWEVTSSEKFWLSYFESRGVLQEILLIFFLIGHCSCVWSIMIGRSRPKGIWGMCQNKANSLSKSSRTHILSEASYIKTC